jgi:hypothetical protein
VKGVLFAERTVLHEFDPVGSVLLVLIVVVIALFAFGASKCNLNSFTVSSHVRHLLFGLFKPVRAVYQATALRLGLPLHPQGAKNKPLRRGATILSHFFPCVKDFFLFIIFFI